MHNERCTSGSERGDGKPISAREHGDHLLLNRMSVSLMDSFIS